MGLFLGFILGAACVLIAHMTVFITTFTTVAYWGSWFSSAVSLCLVAALSSIAATVVGSALTYGLWSIKRLVLLNALVQVVVVAAAFGIVTTFASNLGRLAGRLL